MSDIQFEESSEAVQFRPADQESKSGMVKLLIKIGAAKTERGANTVLVVFSLLMLAITAYLFIAFVF